MASNRYDRQNRVFGIDGTTKLQNSSVVIFGQKSDTMFELAKNLALSGIKKILISIVNEDSIDDASDNFLGNIHDVSYNKMIAELALLNPYCTIKPFTTIEEAIDSVFVFINEDLYNVSIINRLVAGIT